MSELAAGELRDTLERAIEGRAAFRRFKGEVGRSGLLDRWHAYSDERRRGRAREWLAAEDIRLALRDPGRR